jgi:hypothetical protein
VGALSTPLSLIDRMSREAIDKDILELNNIFGKMDLADIYRVFHPTIADYTFLLSVAYGTFSKIDCILVHKANPNKCKKKLK